MTEINRTAEAQRWLDDIYTNKVGDEDKIVSRQRRGSLGDESARMELWRPSSRV